MTEIRNLAFPPDIVIAAGSSVTWVNQDTRSHTVTSSNNVFDSGPLAVAGSFTQPFPVAGSYPYFCRVHASMTGTVTVR